MIGFLRPPEAARGLGGINGNLFAVNRDGLDVCGRLDRQRRRAALADVAAPSGREVLGLKGLLGRGKQRANLRNGVLLISAASETLLPDSL